MKWWSDRENWTVKPVIDPATGKYKNEYFFEGAPAQRIPISSRLARNLAGYALIERDLRMVQQWLQKVHELSKAQLDEEKAGWHLTEKNDLDHNLALGLFVAAVTFYGKCFAQCEGRKIKLERDIIPSELRDAHDNMIRFRNNLAAHSGAEKFEDVQIVLVLKPKDSDQKPVLSRELIQPEALVDLRDEDRGFSNLVEYVRKRVLTKIEEINGKIFTEEINPKGLDYWNSKNLY